MYFYFDPAGMFIGIFALMLMICLLVLCHGVWLIGLWQRLCPFGADPQGAALFLLAAVTPVVSFYALFYADRLRGIGPALPRAEGWRWLALPLSLSLLFLIAARFELDDAPEYRDLGGILDQFGLLTCYWLIATTIIHMAARVFGATRQPPLTSQARVFPAMMLALLTFP